MSGQYSGLQARLKEINQYAEYIPCSGHSLNLVGVRAAECNLQITSFFSLLQKLYAFFSLSTYRWQKLVKSLKEKKILESLSDTRWSARADAVSTIHDSHSEVLDTLDDTW
ncbi:unnamed protein product [Parnassius mnemosyne]|uniref:Uncharacterized protein n=1 Tax=Parnassius mnemosyne TaxID=213953 RepID=A0AAV1KT92_9NEOP